MSQFCSNTTKITDLSYTPNISSQPDIDFTSLDKQLKMSSAQLITIVSKKLGFTFPNYYLYNILERSTYQSTLEK